jgi:thiol:disulfide interchange protein DsbC
MSTGNNITENSYKKTRLDYLSQISDDDVILYSSDNSKHTLTIFSDTSCPYCQKLHNEIDNLISNQVSVKYVLFSRNGSDNDAYNDMVSVWCSKDKKKSLDELFDGSFIEPKTCDNPIDNNYTKAMNLKVNGTPMIFFSDGSVIPGYVSSDKIIEALMSKN